LLNAIFNITDSNTLCQELNSEEWARRRICFQKASMSERADTDTTYMLEEEEFLTPIQLFLLSEEESDL